MIEFKLPDMTCGHCASRVTLALKQTDPLCEVSIDLESQKVHVHSAEDRIALADAGYPPA